MDDPGGILVLFVLAGAGTVGGILLLTSNARARRQAEDPATVGKTPKRVYLMSLVVMGLGWAPFIAKLWSMVSNPRDTSPHNSKGRVLRIKNRARLPQPATGDGWAASEVAPSNDMTTGERVVLGELWLLTARMEHASIAAFSQLSLHLAALGAPARLLEATHRAALDEIRHARQCFAIASAITGTHLAAGPIVELGRAAPGAIDLTRLAIGSLVDGCLAEGMASDVAARGALTAEDPTIRATLTMIATEEIGHAELAWDVLAWCVERGGDPVRAAVRTRALALGREVDPRMPDIPGIDSVALRRHGVVDQDGLGEIAVTRLAMVQERVRELLGDAKRVELAA